MKKPDSEGTLFLDDSQRVKAECCEPSFFLILTLVQARNASSSAQLHMVTSKPGHEIPSSDFEEAPELSAVFTCISVLLPQAPFPHLQCPDASWFAGKLHHH